jgi:hypothetical protein
MNVWAFVRREGRRAQLDIAAMEDLVMTPRCPCCRAFLVARVGNAGPYFMCLCPTQAEKEAVERKAAA